MAVNVLRVNPSTIAGRVASGLGSALKRRASTTAPVLPHTRARRCVESTAVVGRVAGLQKTTLRVPGITRRADKDLNSTYQLQLICSMMVDKQRRQPATEI
jgi:hypothetical protein